jgi:hypothetical protein
MQNEEKRQVFAHEGLDGNGTPVDSNGTVPVNVWACG